MCFNCFYIYTYFCVTYSTSPLYDLQNKYYYYYRKPFNSLNEYGNKFSDSIAPHNKFSRYILIQFYQHQLLNNCIKLINNINSTITYKHVKQIVNKG